MLNKATGNMFPFVDFTWNPQSGCLHDCKYCYASKMAFEYDMTPAFRVHYMKEDLYKKGEGVTIFVTDMGDLFGTWVESNHIDWILSRCLAFPKNKYVLLTKNNGRYLEFFATRSSFSDSVANFLLGTTIETNQSGLWYKQFSQAPPPNHRVTPMIVLRDAGFQILVSIEPIMKFNLTGLLQMIRSISPRIVAVGADSKGCNLPEPEPEQVMDLISALHKFVPIVVIKSNLERLLGPEKYQIASAACTKYENAEPQLSLPGNQMDIPE